MRRNRDGTIHKHSQSLQMQAAEAARLGIPSPTNRDLLRTHMQQALGHVEWFAPRLKAAEALEVVTAQRALLELIAFLERGQSDTPR